MTLHKNLIATQAVAFGLLLTAAPASAGGGAHAFDQSMQPILQNYLEIQTALAADTTKGVQSAGKAIVGQAGKLDASSVTGEHAAHYKDLSKKIAAAAKTLAGASDITAARAAFKQLSKPMAMWGTMSKPKGIDVVFCSMAKGSWLQERGEVRNPYYGKSMLTCGEVVGGDAHGAGHGHSGH